jgi:hypothetical protein
VTLLAIFAEVTDGAKACEGRKAQGARHKAEDKGDRKFNVSRFSFFVYRFSFMVSRFAFFVSRFLSLNSGYQIP